MKYLNRLLWFICHVWLITLPLPAATVIVAFSGRITSIDPRGRQIPPIEIGSEWRVEIAYPQDTTILEQPITAQENVTINVPLATSRVSLGSRTWLTSDISFTYDRIGYAMVQDLLPSATIGEPFSNFSLSFNSYGSPTPMIHRLDYLPSSLGDWDFLGTTDFRFSAGQFYPNADAADSAIEWYVSGSSLDSVTFRIIPEPVSVISIPISLVLIARKRRRMVISC
jgi:hypothetical protein